MKPSTTSATLKPTPANKSVAYSFSPHLACFKTITPSLLLILLWDAFGQITQVEASSLSGSNSLESSSISWWNLLKSSISSFISRITLWLTLEIRWPMWIQGSRSEDMYLPMQARQGCIWEREKARKGRLRYLMPPISPKVRRRSYWLMEEFLIQKTDKFIFSLWFF